MEPWRRIVDTTLASPDDLSVATDAPLVEGGSYRAGPRSVVVLAARRTPDAAAVAGR